jgi:hypothetical protein
LEYSTAQFLPCPGKVCAHGLVLAIYRQENDLVPKWRDCKQEGLSEMWLQKADAA